MYSLNTVEPQVFAALSQISSFFNGVRAVHQTGRLQRKKRVAYASNKEDTAPPYINLSDLPKKMTAADINPLLSMLRIDDTQTPHRSLHESHVSAETFFENKTGFPEKFLKTDLSSICHILKNRSFQTFLQRGGFTPLLQQARGFKTYRGSRVVSGIGTDPQEKFFKSWFQKKDIPTFEKLVKSRNNNPEVQDDLKIAFAEGYHASAETTRKTASYLRIFRYILYGIISLWCANQLLMALISPMNGGVRRLGVLSQDQHEINPEDVTVTFDDVKGVDEAKQELQDVVEFLKDPDKFTALGAKLPKGVLLVGSPGIGKTLLARAVAGEAGVPFFHASGSEFDEIFVGTGAKRIRQLFSEAKQKAPCVIFLDEIDSVGGKRSSSVIHPYANQTVNQLLSEMDGFTQNEGVIVLGATNRKDNLDKALLRAGRFDVEIHVYPPNLKGRQEILDLYVSKIKADNDIDTQRLAKGTTGFTGADLENMVNQAALKAAKDGAFAVAMTHMDFARDKVLMGPAKMRIQDEQTNWVTAYHEAGHTLVAHFTKDATALHKVTIIPRGMALGFTAFIEEKEIYGQTKSQLLAKMDVAMGGRAGEELIYGLDKITTGASGDFKSATTIAKSMVRSLGMSEKVGFRVFESESMVELSPVIQDQLDSEIKRLLQESYERAKTILKSHQPEHKALAQALIEHETLDRNDIKAIIEGKKPQLVKSC